MPRAIRVNLRDLIVLVSGIAAALAVSPVSLPSIPAGMPWASSYALFTVARSVGEWGGKLGTVAAVVVLVRSAWGGDGPRPAEWLALGLGLARLDRILLSDGPFLRLVHRGTGLTWEVGGLVFPTSLALLANLVLMACLIVFRVSRGGLPLAVKLVLLAASILALLWGPVRQLQVALGPSLPLDDPLAPWPRRLASGLARALFGWPDLSLVVLPGVAAFLDWRRGGLRRRTPTEWAGVLAAILVAAGWALEFAGTSLFDRDWGRFATGLVANAASAIALIALSLVVVRRLGPAWSRWIAAGYNAT